MQAVAARQAPGLAYKWRAAVVVGLGLFLSVLDTTIVSVALPAIRSQGQATARMSTQPGVRSSRRIRTRV